MKDSPKIRVVWIRGRHKPSAKLDFESPQTFLSLGIKGSGKSCLLEVLAIKYKKIIDIFGSRDNEALAWCRSPLFSKNEILFLTGDSVELKCRWDVVKIREFKVEDLEKYRIVISASAFYGSLDEEFRSLNDLIYGILYRRTHWKVMYYILIREASNFLYSRVKITRNQTIAKHDFIYLLRESRHMGYAVGVDTIRWTSLDKEIRDVADYTFVKRVGVIGLPRDLRFVYKYFDPLSLMDPPVETFVVISNRGHIGIGNFDYPKWHKTEREDILKKLHIKPEYGEIPRVSEDARNIVGDFEHGTIITKRLEGSSMRKIAEEIKRSNQTIHAHIKEHNRQVRTRGFCDKCNRIKSPHSRTRAEALR